MNLFVWPARDRVSRTFAKDGLSVTEWSRDGVRYAAVFELPEPRLCEFETLFLNRAD